MNSSTGVMGRLAVLGAGGFVGAQLIALSMRDHDFRVSVGSAALEHIGAWFFLLFAASFPHQLEIWERVEDERTPGTTGATIAFRFLAVMLLAATVFEIAQFEKGDWSAIANALDAVCLLPLVVVVPFVIVATLPAGAPSGFAFAGGVVALGGLLRAGSLLVERDEHSIFARGSLVGAGAFVLFSIWIGVAAFLAARRRA